MSTSIAMLRIASLLLLFPALTAGQAEIVDAYVLPAKFRMTQKPPCKLRWFTDEFNSTTFETSLTRALDRTKMCCSNGHDMSVVLHRGWCEGKRVMSKTASAVRKDPRGIARTECLVLGALQNCPRKCEGCFPSVYGYDEEGFRFKQIDRRSNALVKLPTCHMSFLEGVHMEVAMNPQYIFQGDINILFRSAITILDVMSECGVLHGDLLPKNMFLRSDGTLAVFDFGFSQSRAWRWPSNLRADHFGGICSAARRHSTINDQFSMACSLKLIFRHTLSPGHPLMNWADVVLAHPHHPMEKVKQRLERAIEDYMSSDWRHDPHGKHHKDPEVYIFVFDDLVMVNKVVWIEIVQDAATIVGWRVLRPANCSDITREIGLKAKGNCSALFLLFVKDNFPRRITQLVGTRSMTVNAKQFFLINRINDVHGKGVVASFNPRTTWNVLSAFGLGKSEYEHWKAHHDLPLKFETPDEVFEHLELLSAESSFRYVLLRVRYANAIRRTLVGGFHHGTMDLLVSDVQLAVDWLGLLPPPDTSLELLPLSRMGGRRSEYAMMIGEHVYTFYLRAPGDGFLPVEWGHDMFEKRVRRQNAWSIGVLEHFFYHLYRIVVHSNEKVTPKVNELRTKWQPICGDAAQATQYSKPIIKVSFDSSPNICAWGNMLFQTRPSHRTLKHYLDIFMRKRHYVYVLPDDPVLRRGFWALEIMMYHNISDDFHGLERIII